MNKSRIFGLDVFRAFAIIFVVIAHGLHYLPKELSRFLDLFIIDGVSIFFVLSGFLIGSILIKSLEEKEFKVNDLIIFWKKRWYRTLPNYFLILIILLLINVLFDKEFKIKDHISYFFFLQNFKSSHPHFFPEAWSLSVEEWFYIITPLLIYFQITFLKISNKKSLMFVIVFIIASVTFFRLYRYGINLIPKNDTMWQYHYRKQVITRLDGIMFGVLMAFIKFYHETFLIKFRKIAFIVGLLLLIGDKLYFYIYEDYRSFYSCVISFSTLPFLCYYDTKNSRVKRIITHISVISYSLYLIHFSLVQFYVVPITQISFDYAILKNPFLVFSFYIFVSLLISTLLYKYYEVPTMRLRDKLLKKVICK
jgi:peptidoglycan/LPS O-acetylase OafA/YrhL